MIHDWAHCIRSLAGYTESYDRRYFDFTFFSFFLLGIRYDMALVRYGLVVPCFESI
jgi:hypothetical protein